MAANKRLELRMYGIVPYNISAIQAGIQFGHAVVEYMVKYPSSPETRRLKRRLGGTYDLRNKVDRERMAYEWAKEHKTFVILNGGTTNETHWKLGSMQKHLQFLQKQGWPHATFHEPDLNDTLTAVVFIMDETMFNFRKHPDYPVRRQAIVNNPDIKTRNSEPLVIVDKFIDKRTDKGYREWVKKMGGKKKLAIREYFRNFKLA